MMLWIEKKGFLDYQNVILTWSKHLHFQSVYSKNYKFLIFLISLNQAKLYRFKMF